MEFKLPEKCLACNSEIKNQGHVVCLKCGKHCDPFALNQEDLDDTPEGTAVGVDVKSTCCKADVRLVDVRATCSDSCHEKMVAKMEKDMGEFFYDVDNTGVLRKIPTREIFEKGGITQEELQQYPAADVPRVD